MASDIIAFIRTGLLEDVRIAREASGSTVIGEPGNWTPSPAGDEWEAHAGEIEEELLVALRPGLPRPPEVMSGYWGAWVSNEPDDCDPDAGSAMPALIHAARHDPARVLAEVAVKNRLLERHQPKRNPGVDSDADDPETWVICCEACQVEIVKPGDWPCEPLRLLAFPYAGRQPGYDEEWLPIMGS
jgi:hypothetical protein